jgi:hypothetical protein
MTAARRYDRFITALLLVLLSISCGPAQAQEAEPFVVERADFRLDNSMLLLDLVVGGQIPDYIAIAIDKGFPVPFMFEVEIRARKRYWLDDPVVSLKQQYLLHYQPMLDSYVVFDVNNSERRYFDDLQMAVRFMEVVYNYSMLDINNLAPDREYYARVRYGIDTDELPLPLQSSWPWDDDWDLESDWFEWEVQSPAL